MPAPCRPPSSAQPSPIPFAVATRGIAFFSGMDAVMKDLTLALGTYNAMLWRIAGGRGPRRRSSFSRCAAPGRRGAAMRIHLIRGTMSSVMAILFFWGLARVPLAQGVALAFVAPLIALYLAALILKEQIERRAILASLLGFAGVLVILAGQAQARAGPGGAPGRARDPRLGGALRLEHHPDAPAGAGRQAGRDRLLHQPDRHRLLPARRALPRRARRRRTHLPGDLRRAPRSASAR